MPTDVTYLSLEHIEAIHSRAIRRDGGSPDYYGTTRGKIDAALQRPQNAAYYEGANFVTQVAKLFHSLITAHAFVDGNKRVAFYATAMFMLINGWRFTCGQDELYEFIIGCCEHTESGLPYEPVEAFCVQNIAVLLDTDLPDYVASWTLRAK